MEAGDLMTAQVVVARRNAFAAEVRSFHHAVRRKANKIERVNVQVKAAIQETQRVLKPKKKKKAMTKSELFAHLHKKYRKLGLTRKQADAKAARHTKALFKKQEAQYLDDAILKYAATSNVKPIAKLPSSFSSRAQKVEVSSQIKKIGQQASARGRRLGLKGAALHRMRIAAETRASKRIKKAMQQRKALRIAKEQAARLGVDKKIESMNIPSPAEKVVKKPKKLTVAEQLKRVADIVTALKGQSSTLQKQNGALQAQVSKLSAKVLAVPALQTQVATLRNELNAAKKKAGSGTK